MNETSRPNIVIGHLIAYHTLADGSALALHRSGSGGGSRRKFGLWRTLRVLRLAPGTRYQSSRSKGVKVLWERAYDERSNAANVAINAGEAEYEEVVARARLTDASALAAESMADD